MHVSEGRSPAGGFLSLGAVDVWGGINLCGGGRPVPLRQEAPGLHPLDACSAAYLWQTEVSLDVARCPLEAKLSWLRTPGWEGQAVVIVGVC